VYCIKLQNHVFLNSQIDRIDNEAKCLPPAKTKPKADIKKSQRKESELTKRTAHILGILGEEVSMESGFLGGRGRYLPMIMMMMMMMMMVVAMSSGKQIKKQ